MIKTLQSFTRVVSSYLALVKDDKKFKAMLAMLCYTPLFSSNKIGFIKQLVKGIPNDKVCEVCAKALDQAKPDTAEAMEILNSAKEYIHEQISK